MSHLFKCSLGGLLEDDVNYSESTQYTKSNGWEPSEYNSSYKPRTHLSLMDKEDLESSYDRMLMCDHQYSLQLVSALQSIWGDNNIISESIDAQSRGVFFCSTSKSATASHICNWEQALKIPRVLGNCVVSATLSPPNSTKKYSGLQPAQAISIEKQLVFRSSREWRPCEYLSRLSCSKY